MADRLPDIVQTDFTGGQINKSMKRRDQLEFVKTGARQMSNWRIEATGTLITRPAKRPVFSVAGGRNEYVRMQSTKEFMLSFGVDPNSGHGVIEIFSLDGLTSVIYSSPGYIWTASTLNLISWCVAQFDIVVCYPGMQPQIARWSPPNQNWTFLPYSFRVIDSQVQEPFYRFSAPGATMTYFAQTGTTQLQCSVPYFTPSMVGMNLSIVGQQVTIQGVSDPQNATVTIAYYLPDIAIMAVSDGRPFQVGMVVEGLTNNIKMELNQVEPGHTSIIEVGPGTPGLVGSTTIIGVMLSNLVCDLAQFLYGTGYYDSSGVYHPPDLLVSPIGSSQWIEPPSAIRTNGKTVEWTEEFMCPYRGWPSRCSYTSGRLCFYGFPQMQEAILWSAVGANDVCWVDAVAAANQPEAGTEPDSAILEFEASRPAIVSVLDWGDIFVFTDRGIFEIPVASSGQPLSPGNVVFRRFSNDGVSIITPVSTQDCIVYINAGLNRCSVVRATGSYTRPYVSEDVSESHAPLFTGPVSLAIATGDGPYPERYVYVTMADGSIVVGKFTQNRTLIGWVPWTSPGACQWVTNAGPKVWFTSLYSSALGLNYILELEEPLYYLDGMQFLNAPGPGMTNGGLGPLWHLAGMTVQVVDQQGVPPGPDNIPQGLVDYGDRMVDGNGFIILQPSDAAWSSSPTVYAGLWPVPVLEPFLFPPHENAAKPGARGKRRGLHRLVISVQHSNGFDFGQRTIPPVNWLEDPTVAQIDPPFPLPAPFHDRQRDYPGAVGPDPYWGG